MRFIILILIIFYSLIGCCQKYNRYYELINSAEQQLLENSLDSCLYFYKTAFNQFTPMKVDLMNFLILVHKYEKDEISLTDSIVGNHLIQTKRQKKQVCKSFRAIKAPKSLLNHIKRINNDYLRSETRAEVVLDSLLKVDQRIRNPILWTVLSTEKLNRINLSIYKALMDYANKNGYPNISTSPVDDATIILVHAAQFMDSTTLNFLKYQVLEGKLHPKSYAYIYYRYSYFSNGFDKYGGSPFLGMADNENLINSNRTIIGLTSLSKFREIESMKVDKGLFSQF